MPIRAAMLARLLEILRPQVRPGVDLNVRESDPSQPVGENREVMRQESNGEYICFIDDDDLVPPWYVASILPTLDGAADYIGFNVEQRIDGQVTGIERRSLEYRNVWRSEYGGRYRDISHLNPMRRSLALEVPMSGYPGEDGRWADGTRAKRILKTEHYIDQVLYYQLTRSSKSELQNPPVPPSPYPGPLPWTIPKVKVRMRQAISGGAIPKYDLPEFWFGPGQAVDIHEELARTWVQSGQAEAVQAPSINSATILRR